MKEIRQFTKRHYSYFVAGGGFVLLALIILTAMSYARENGITGRTGPSSGCTCHTSNPNTSTTVTVSSQSGSFTVNTGQTATFTVTVSNSGRAAAGTNIAVKTTETGETNAGTLEPGTGSGLQLLNSELTHTQPKTISGGSASFTFTWTAPGTPGTYYLRAAGNAVNANGEADGNDQWNRMTVQQITVQAAPEVVLTSPNGGEAWCPGSSHNITWTSSNVQNVKIELSTDGGSSFPVTLVNSVQASLGTWSWAIPAALAPGTQYKVRISDISNSATNDVSNANFTIASQATITTQPQPLTACEGQAASFSVTATGGGLTYQWRKDGGNISGATAATYNIPTVNPTHAGFYDVIVTGACGDPVTSSQAILTVNAKPMITVQPVAQQVCVGNSVDLTVTATGAGITYQWRRNSVPVPNGNSATLTINNAQPANDGTYDVVVSGTCTPSVTSVPVTLTVNLPPAITVQPKPTLACLGGTAQFSVSVAGSGLQLQWRKDGLPIPNATDTVLTINNITAASAGAYDVVLTGACPPEVISDMVMLDIALPVAVTQQPQSQTVLTGSTVNLSVAATGSAIQYQWRKEGAPLAGKTQPTLSLANVTTANAGTYDVLLSNACGTVTSSPAVLTVTTPGGGPVLTLSTAAIDFGLVMAYSSKDTTINAAIKNVGDKTLNISNAVITGTDPTQFLLLDDLSGVSIEPNGVINLRVRFFPTSAGDKTAKIEFTSNSPVNPSILLSGIGGLVNVVSSVNKLEYGSVNVGSQKDLSFSLENIGNVDAFIESFSITGSQSSNFQVLAPITPSGIEVGESQQITVRFTPTEAGAAEAELNIKFQGFDQPMKVQLMGNAVASVFDSPEAAAMNLQVYPNPANGEIMISFQPSLSEIYEISVVDVLGSTLYSYNLESAGANSFKWNGRDMLGNQVPAGMYRLILKTSKAAASVPVSITR